MNERFVASLYRGVWNLYREEKLTRMRQGVDETPWTWYECWEETLPDWPDWNKHSYEYDR